MDALQKIRNLILGNSSQPQPSSEKPAENPMDSARAQSNSYLSNTVGDEAITNITSDHIGSKQLHTDSATKLTLPNTSPAKNTAPPSSSTTSPAITGTASPAQSTVSPSANQVTTSKSNTAIYTPTKPVVFSDSVQNDFFQKLRPEALDLVSRFNLTKTEAAAIYAYTRDDYYRTINAALRTVNKDGQVDVSSAASLKDAGSTDDGLNAMIAATVSGMKKLPCTQTSDSVFLPLGRNDSVPEEFLEPYAQGASITIAAFYSSTVSMATVEQWWDGTEHFLSVLQNVNGNGRDISAFSEFPHEKEVLFLPGTKFMVLGRTERTVTPSGSPNLPGNSRTKTKILMQLQEVSSNPNDPLPPTIHPSTFQSLSAPIKPEKFEASKSEKKSVYFGFK